MVCTDNRKKLLSQKALEKRTSTTLKRAERVTGAS